MARTCSLRVFRVLWRILAWGTLWGLLLVPAIVPRGWQESLAKQSASVYQLCIEAISFGSCLLATFCLLRWADRKTLADIKFAFPVRLSHLALGVCAGIFWLAASLAPIALLGGLEYQAVTSWPWTILLVAALAALLNAAMQELLCTGYLFHTLRLHLGSGAAFIGAPLCFALLHAGALKGAWLPALNVFLAGLLFCLIAQRTGSLWSSIAAHFTWNFLEGTVLGLPVSGRDFSQGWQLLKLQGSNLLSGGNFGFEGSASVTVCTLVLCAAVGLSLWRKRGTIRRV